MKEKIINIGKRVLEIEGNALLDGSKFLDESFEKVVNLILNTRGKVIVIGMGKSGHIGKKIAASLASTGTPSFFIHPGEAFHGDLGMIEKKDLALVISNSGKAQEITGVLKNIKKIGAKIVAITKNKKSPLSEMAHITLPLVYEREACPLNLAPTVSSTLTLALGDALVVALMFRRKFSKENYGLFHPGGSLGKETTKISELIASKKVRNVTIGKDAMFQDAISVLLSSRRGGLNIVNSRRKFVGLITDGDIKRVLNKSGKGVFNLRVSQIMSRHPIVGNPNLTIQEAINLMEKRKDQLSVLPIIEKGKPVSLVRIHDLI